MAADESRHFNELSERLRKNNNISRSTFSELSVPSIPVMEEKKCTTTNM